MEIPEREEALKLLKSYVQNDRLISHMLAAEALMKTMAVHFSEDEALWGLTGLIHDLDVEITKDNQEQHGLLSAKILEEKGYPKEIINAVKSHCGKVPCSSRLDYVLYAVDPLTGFIVACALMVKDPVPKKLSSLDVNFALRRFKEKHFARGASREQILSCTDFGFTLEQFLGVGIKSMTAIDKELGL